MSAGADVRVIDGDTIEQNGTTYRINGIDAPGYVQKCGKASGDLWRCGERAADELVRLTANRSVERKTHSLDGYGRSVANCFSDGVDFGAEMVRSGYAWAFVRYSDAYIADEAIARSAKVGVWQGEATPAWEYRDQR